MREILFKAKRISDGQWVEGYLFETKDNSYIGYEGQFDDDLFLSPKNIFIPIIKNDTICQYTGLNDKNGNKIWENDIVKAEVKQNSLRQSSLYSDFYQISYHEKYCYFYLKKKNNNLLFDGNWSYYLKTIEVIGNIFDNPELLGGSK